MCITGVGNATSKKQYLHHDIGDLLGFLDRIRFVRYLVAV